MTAPDSSPLAHRLAAGCVHVTREGSLTRVYYRAPGTAGPTLCYSVHTSATAHLAERDARALAAMLAPLVDLGLRRGEVSARTTLPGIRAVQPTGYDPDNDLDPDG